MESYILTDYWGSLVRNFKESEKKFGLSAYETERLAQDILSYVTFTRIRQYNLFVQQRGEDFERMVIKLKERNYSEEAIQRFLQDERLWKTTLELGEQ
jgi:hypothetical protein